MALLGSYTSDVLNALGLILLLPGSVLASLSLAPLNALDLPKLLTSTGTDGPGLANVLYLPLTIAINLACAFAIKKLISRASRMPLTRQ
jgi:hypothetical protein